MLIFEFIADGPQIYVWEANDDKGFHWTFGTGGICARHDPAPWLYRRIDGHLRPKLNLVCLTSPRRFFCHVNITPIQSTNIVIPLLNR